MQSITSYNPDNGTSAVTLYSDDGRLAGTIVETHPKYQEILDALAAGASDEEIDQLLHPERGVAEKLVNIMPGFSYDGNLLTYNGRIVDGLPAKQVLRLMRDESHTGSDVRAVANFVVKLLDNPSHDVYENLMKWAQDRNLTFAPDGDLIAYKGVNLAEDGVYYSCHSSKRPNMVSVNGKLQDAGPVANTVGAVIEMDRRLVDDDNSNGCSQGLHAGTYDYARGYGNGALLKVAINPRDVVSVPSDSSFQKLRVCRYRVMETTTYEIPDLVYYGSDYNCNECDDPDCDGSCEPDCGCADNELCPVCENA
jgi:hypothetical protein